MLLLIRKKRDGVGRNWKLMKDSISEYLRNGQVQMGASYGVGVRSSGRVQSGYEAGARYIGAESEEIGMVSFFLRLGIFIFFKVGIKQ